MNSHMNIEGSSSFPIGKEPSQREEKQDLRQSGGLLGKILQSIQSKGEESVDKEIKQLANALSTVKNWEEFAKKCGKNIEAEKIYEALLSSFGKEEDWSVLENVSPPLQFRSSFEANNPVIGAFNKFIGSYSVPGKNVSAEEILKDFTTQLDLFLKGPQTVFLQKESLSSSEGGISYEQIYQKFSSQPSEEEFQKKLTEFYTAYTEEHGYFIPSHATAEWIKELNDSLGTPKTLVAASSSTPSAEELKTMTMMDLIGILIEMTQSLQELAVVQANRLELLTNIQKDYTEKEGAVPFFSKDGNPIWGYGGTKQQTDKDKISESGAIRDELNTKSQSLINEQQAERGLYEDMAKSLQNDLNSTTKALDDQSELIQSLLDQARTLTSQLYR